MRKKIAILLHEKDTYPVQSPHLIWTLCDLWREQGIEVEVLKGISQRIDADLLLPHIDLTFIPKEYTDFFESYHRVANRRLHSIAKRQISSNLLASSDPYEGKVIVKTNLNFAGIPEEKVYGVVSGTVKKSLLCRVLGKMGVKWTTSPDWKALRRMKLDDYRIFDSLQQVPGDVFENENLIVERFLPEYENGLYYVRIYQFVGDRGYCVKIGSTEPVVKQKNIVSREVVDIPNEVVDYRSQAGIDFGKLDFVIHQGRVIVLDVNRTPGLIKPAEVLRQRSSLLAPGINSLF